MEAESELLPLLETIYRSSNPTRRWLHCSRRDWILDKLRECALGDRRRAIEVGFGTGLYLPTMAELFEEAVGSDLDQAHLDHARPLLARYPNLRLVRDNIVESCLPPHQFQVALCSEVIEHIPDTGRVLTGIRRLLAPGGKLILSTPQKWSVMEMAAKVAFLPGIAPMVRWIYGEAVRDMEHTNVQTAAEIERHLLATGFSIRERYKSGLYLPLLAEFGGAAGQRLLEALENRLRGRALDSLLWTQYYVAEA